MRSLRIQLERHRRRKRGLVVVEALISVGFFATILIAALFVHHVCRAKLSVMNQARTAAWVHGIAGCKTQALRGESFAAAAAGVARNDMSVPDDALRGTLTINDESAKKSERVRGIGHFLGVEVSGTSTVACNDVPAEATGVDALFKLFARKPF